MISLKSLWSEVYLRFTGLAASIRLIDVAMHRRWRLASAARYTRAMTNGQSLFRCVLTTACMVLAGCAQMNAQSVSADSPARTYDVTYTVELEAGTDTAEASIRLDRGARRVSELRFRIDPERQSDFRGDGEVSTEGKQVIWNPPRDGGTLSYAVEITHKRSNGAYDARVTDDWALFRADRIFPPATTIARGSAESDATLTFKLPDGWSALTTYLSGKDELTFPVDNPERRFDRPTGWVLVGELGVRRGLIADTRVAIAAPVGENVRRMDVMAFLNWTLPGVRRVFPSLDPRLVIVSAGDPMWRGGLSGPGSLYVHADRPLISEDGTSTFLHELVHVAMGVAGSDHDDWLVEGLAEYYSIKILLESGTLSDRRMELALEYSRQRGADIDSLFVDNASGDVTARATSLLYELDTVLQQESPDGRGLDDVVIAMIENEEPYSYRALCIAARNVLRRPVPLLSPTLIPGAPALEECIVN